MSDQPPEPEVPADAPPAVAPWISTQHEMETAARPGRTRLFRLRMKSGHVRVAAVTYFESTAHGESDTRVTAGWGFRGEPKLHPKTFPEKLEPYSTSNNPVC